MAKGLSNPRKIFALLSSVAISGLVWSSVAVGVPAVESNGALRVTRPKGGAALSYASGLGRGGGAIGLPKLANIDTSRPRATAGLNEKQYKDGSALYSDPKTGQILFAQVSGKYYELTWKGMGQYNEVFLATEVKQGSNEPAESFVVKIPRDKQEQFIPDDRKRYFEETAKYLNKATESLISNQFLNSYEAEGAEVAAFGDIGLRQQAVVRGATIEQLLQEPGKSLGEFAFTTQQLNDIKGVLGWVVLAIEDGQKTPIPPTPKYFSDLNSEFKPDSHDGNYMLDWSTVDDPAGLARQWQSRGKTIDFWDLYNAGVRLRLIDPAFLGPK